MIAKIDGLLDSIMDGVAMVNVGGGLTYEVLVSGYTAGRLGTQIGQTVTLHTAHYFESSNQGATLVPRLAGFQTLEDRRFFALFTTCKGIGQRKALRAMTLDTAQVATAIADRDVILLQSLPEIGKRTAETIVETLHDRVDTFLSSPSQAPSANQGAAAMPSGGGVVREALEVLVK